MGYLRLTLKKNNQIKKYILFYASYLNEAWLSEIAENETTKIVKQFECKNTYDLDALVAYISRKGELTNLTAENNVEGCMKIIKRKLRKSPRKAVDFGQIAHWVRESFPIFRLIA